MYWNGFLHQLIDSPRSNFTILPRFHQMHIFRTLKILAIKKPDFDANSGKSWMSFAYSIWKHLVGRFYYLSMSSWKLCFEFKIYDVFARDKQCRDRFASKIIKRIFSFGPCRQYLSKNFFEGSFLYTLMGKKLINVKVRKIRILAQK